MPKIAKEQPPLIITLSNNIRLVYRQVRKIRVLHCAVMLDIGSRDEQLTEHGMTHFIEHMLFKGTQKRKSFHILNRIDSIGGELNAYTQKDKICLYTTTTREYLSRSLELLQDIVFHATFPEKEIEKEKLVIHEEIDMVKDNPEEAIFETFDELYYQDHPLAHPILGNNESIDRFTSEQLKNFYFNTHLSGNRIAVSIVGDCAPGLIEKYFRLLFETKQPTGRQHLRRQPSGQVRFEHTHVTKGQQAHLIIGGAAAAMQEEAYFAFVLLNNYIGGPFMNSLLSLNIREKYGLAYNLYSFYNPLLDSGIWGVYAGCDKANLTRMHKLISRELKQLCDNPFSPALVARIKKQFLGSLTISWENTGGQMMAQARDILDFEEVISFDEIKARYQSVSAAMLQQTANQYFHPDKLSVLIYEPQNGS